MNKVCKFLIVAVAAFMLTSCVAMKPFVKEGKLILIECKKGIIGKYCYYSYTREETMIHKDNYYHVKLSCTKIIHFHFDGGEWIGKIQSDRCNDPR